VDFSGEEIVVVGVVDAMVVGAAEEVVEVEVVEVVEVVDVE
jgi:hypothetical protein